MSEHKFLEKCECGGEYQSCDGITLDSWPTVYPVCCTQCSRPGSAHLVSEAKAAGWNIESLRKQWDSTGKN